MVSCCHHTSWTMYIGNMSGYAWQWVRSQYILKRSTQCKHTEYEMVNNITAFLRNYSGRVINCHFIEEHDMQLQQKCHLSIYNMSAWICLVMNKVNSIEGHNKCIQNMKRSTTIRIWGQPHSVSQGNLNVRVEVLGETDSPSTDECEVMGWVQTWLSFAILRATNHCVHGSSSTRVKWRRWVWYGRWGRPGYDYALE